MTSDTSAAPVGAFHTTHWSVVLRAGQADCTKAEDALAALCRSYWYPLYAFVRRRGHDREEAKDLTQEFFAKLLENNFLKSVDREKGRFRSFLLTCIQHFLSNERKKGQSIKRGGQYSFVSLDETVAEDQYAHEPVERLTPETLFERRWALTVLDRTFTTLRREYTRQGQDQQFQVLQVYLSGAKDASSSYAQAAAQLGVTEAAARQAAHRMRRRYGQILRAEIAETVSTPTEIENELAHLQAALAL